MLKYRTDTFRLNTGAGSQAYTGLGFQPKILFLTSIGTTFDDYINDGSQGVLSMGVTDGTTVVGMGHAQKFDRYSNGGSPTTENINSWMDTSSMVRVLNQPPLTTNRSLVQLTSLDADGFTLNVITPPPIQDFVGFMAIGGDSVTSAKVGTFTSANATGDQAVTGIGFKPDFIILFSQLLASDNTSRLSEFNHCVGMGNATGQFATCATSQKLSTSGQYSVTSGDVGYIFLGARNLDSNTAPSMQATLVSMDADGFTINWNAHDSGAVAIGYIAIKGTFQTYVSAVTAGTGTTDTQTIQLPFTAQGFFFPQSFGATAHTSFHANEAFSGYGLVDDNIRHYANGHRAGFDTAGQYAGRSTSSQYSNHPSNSPAIAVLPSSYNFANFNITSYAVDSFWGGVLPQYRHQFRWNKQSIGTLPGYVPCLNGYVAFGDPGSGSFGFMT